MRGVHKASAHLNIRLADINKAKRLIERTSGGVVAEHVQTEGLGPAAPGLIGSRPHQRTGNTLAARGGRYDQKVQHGHRAGSGINRPGYTGIVNALSRIEHKGSEHPRAIARNKQVSLGLRASKAIGGGVHPYLPPDVKRCVVHGGDGLGIKRLNGGKVVCAGTINKHLSHLPTSSNTYKKAPPKRGLIKLVVETKGIEPSASAMRRQRSPS